MSILETGAKVHAGLLANFEGQARRAFIGVVEAYEDGVARVRGKSWLYDALQGVYVPKADARVRLISVTSGRYVFNVFPPETEMSKVRYERRPDGTLLLTDGRALAMDVSEGDVRRSRAQP